MSKQSPEIFSHNVAHKINRCHVLTYMVIKYQENKERKTMKSSKQYVAYNNMVVYLDQHFIYTTYHMVI